LRIRVLRGGCVMRTAAEKLMAVRYRLLVTGDVLAIFNGCPY
jgi:hypothetical protein